MNIHLWRGCGSLVAIFMQSRLTAFQRFTLSGQNVFCSHITRGGAVRFELLKQGCVMTEAIKSSF